MPITLGPVQIGLSSWPSLSLWSGFNVPADWKLGPAKATASRNYGGKVITANGLDVRIIEGGLSGWRLSIGSLLVVDREWKYFIPDNFYASNIVLEAPDYIGFTTGNIGSLGSIDFGLYGGKGTGHYLTMLPGINAGTSPAIEEDLARRERLARLAAPYYYKNKSGRYVLDEISASRDPEYMAALAAVNQIPVRNRLQGLFSLQARSAEFSLFDDFHFSVSGTEQIPGFRAEYSLDYDPIEESNRLLDNRAYISLDNVTLDVGIRGTPLLSVRSASLPGSPDIEMRAGNWGLQPDDPLLQIARLDGSLTLFPFETADGSVVYPRLSLTGLEVQQDKDWSLDGVVIELPEGAVGSVGIAGIVPLDIKGLNLAFKQAANGNIDLSQTTVWVTGTVNQGLLQRQLRQLTHSPALTLSLYGWSGSGRSLIRPDQPLTVGFRLDQSSGALRILSGPTLRLDLEGLAIPTPGGQQASFSGSLMLAGTDSNGRSLDIPAGLLVDAGVTDLLPDNFQGAQILMAGGVHSVDGLTHAAALLTGGLHDHANGSTLTLNGQLRLEGSLLAEQFQLGGAIEAALSWQLETRRGPSGQLAWSGFPTIDGVGLQEVGFEVPGVLRIVLDQLSWTATPQLDPVTGSGGLVAWARGLSLEVLKGALKGQTFRTSSAEVRLFDLNAHDGVPDHFFIAGLDLALSEVALGPLHVEGLQLSLEGLTNLPGLADNSVGIRGAISVEADRAQLEVGGVLRGALLPPAPPAGSSDAPPSRPALRGSFDPSSGDLSLSLQRFEAVLKLGGLEALTLEASGSDGGNALRLALDADADTDAAVISLPALLGAMPLLAVETVQGRLAPSLQLNGLAIQNDGDVELGAIELSLPEGFARQWSLGGLLPVELQSLNVRFDPRPDGSADLGRPLIKLRGHLNTDQLEQQLRDHFDAPALDISLGTFDVDGQIKAIDGSAEITLEARIDSSRVGLRLLNSPGWRLQIDDLPLPIPGKERPLLAGDLLLPGTDASGDVLSLPSSVIRSLAQEAGASEETTTSLILRSPQVAGLLRGALPLDEGGSGNLFAADGLLLLGGSLTMGAGGASALALAGEAQLSPDLRFPGLSANANLSTGFTWDLISTPQGSGEITLDGSFRLNGASIGDLNLRIDGVLDLQLNSLSWYDQPRIDRVATQITPGLVSFARGLRLEFLMAPLAGLQLGGPNSEVRLYDLEAADGLADHVFLAGDAFSITGLDLGWLKADQLALELQNISNLPVLDSTPGDGSSLSGGIELTLQKALVGSDLSMARASGHYDLATNSLLLNLQGLAWSRHGVTLQAEGQLRVDPHQPDDRWLQLEAVGSLQTGLPGLDPLSGEMALHFNSSLQLTGMEATLRAALVDRWLGDLEVLGELRFSYDAALDQAILMGSVRLAGVVAAASIRFKAGEQGFEASLTISNQSTLQLADWLQLTPTSLELLYTYDPGHGGRLDLDGKARMTLLERSLELGADLQVGFSGSDHQATLLGGSLQLLNPLEGVTIAGFTIDLVADRAGKLPAIRLETNGSSLEPSINGAMRLRDLGDLTVQLDPERGAITRTSNGWSLENCDIDLTPSGPLNLGLLALGDGAYLRYADGSFTLHPDLSLNSALLGKVLAPVSRLIDQTITPMTRPVVDLLLREIPIEPLAHLETLKPEWVWDWTWDPIAKTGRDLYSNLLATIESTPGNSFRDGKVQVVELVDFTSYSFYRLLKDNPSLGRLLAEQLGVPAAYVAAISKGAPFISLAAGIKKLDMINQLAARVRQAEANVAGTGIGKMVSIPDLSFRFRPGVVAETLGSIGVEAQDDSAVVQALLEMKQAWRSDAAATASPTGSAQGSSLFNVDVDLGVPVLDDPLGSLLALLKGKQLDVIRFNVGLEAGLSFEANQSLPVPIGPVVLPLVVGAQAQLRGELNASLGLSTDAASLLRFSADLMADGGLPEAVLNLLAPVDREGLGVYLAGNPGQPLLRLDPMIRVQGGLDAGIAGVRAFAALNGSLDVQLAAERLYLGNLVKTLSAASPPTLDQLAELMSFDANVSALFGIDTKIGSWNNLVTTTLPLYSLSTPRVIAGPVIDCTVLLDTRQYDTSGALISNLNLATDSGELTGRTDSQGAYRFAGSADPLLIGNRDGVLDFRDGMVIAGHRNSQSSGQRISLVDAISGVDLGIPLVGLPGGPVTTLTTLKYTNLLRWNPNKMLGGFLQTPELITELFAAIVKDVPAAFMNDDLDPYQLIASGDDQRARQGTETLIFGYQHLAAVLAIKELLKYFELDYEEEAAWGFKPQPQSLDTPELVAFAAYGLAIQSLFGPHNNINGVNSLDSMSRLPIAAQYDVSNPAHLRALFKEVLANYPTRRLFAAARELGLGESLASDFIPAGRTPAQQARIDQLIEASNGPRLDNIAFGLAAITQVIQERLEAIRQLDSVLPIQAPQLFASAIAGPKRLVLGTLVPSLIAASGNPDRQQFQESFLARFYSPTTVDLADRKHPFLVRASASATANSSVAELDRLQPMERATITIGLWDQSGRPIEAPDYGLAIRFRLGGTAVEGVHYTLPALHSGHLAYVQPGASSTNLEVSLSPAFFTAADPLLQLELLSADSGFEVDPQAAVVNLRLRDGATPALDGSSRQFQAQGLVAGLNGIHNQLVATQGQRNAVLRGLNGLADTFVLRPEMQALPHLENFRPQEGDRLLVDPEALSRLRRTPGLVRHDAAIQTEAARVLKTEMGDEVLASLSPETLVAEHERVMKALDPLPELRLDQLNTYGGLLFDLVSHQPLALLSDVDQQGRDLAWSALSTDPRVGAIGWVPALTPSPNQPGMLTLGDRHAPFEATVLLRATLSQRPVKSSQVFLVVLDADELERADSVFADPAVIRSRGQLLFSSLEASDVTLPPGTTFEREVSLCCGQSIRVYEIHETNLQAPKPGSAPRLELLTVSPPTPSVGSVSLSSSTGLALRLELQDSQSGLEELISRNPAMAPLLDLRGLDLTSVNGRVEIGREADYDAITGFYKTLDTFGSVKSVDGLRVIRPGEPGYAEAALTEANLVVALAGLAVGDSRTSVREFTLSEASVLAPYATVRGQTFFAFPAANLDHLGHFHNLGRLRFGLEDMLGGGDNDMDDLVMSFSFRDNKSVIR